jgi:hypothetical protein
MNFENALVEILQGLNNGKNDKSSHVFDYLDFLDILVENGIYKPQYYSEIINKKTTLCKKYGLLTAENWTNKETFCSYVSNCYLSKIIDLESLKKFKKMFDDLFGKKCSDDFSSKYVSSETFISSPYKTPDGIETTCEQRKMAEKYLYCKGYPLFYRVKLQTVRRITNNDLMDYDFVILCNEKKAIIEMTNLIEYGVPTLDGDLRNFDCLDFLDILSKYSLKLDNKENIKKFLNVLLEGSNSKTTTQKTIREIVRKIIEERNQYQDFKPLTTMNYEEFMSMYRESGDKVISKEEKQQIWDYLENKGYPVNKIKLLENTLRRYVNNDIKDLNNNKPLKLSK